MEKWQLYEKHEGDVKRVLKEDGCMDHKGQIRSWHGKRTDDKLLESGHDTLDFKSCKCQKQQ